MEIIKLVKLSGKIAPVENTIVLNYILIVGATGKVLSI